MMSVTGASSESGVTGLFRIGSGIPFFARLLTVGVSAALLPFAATSAGAQTGLVSGRVSSADAGPLPNVEVTLLDPPLGTVTDARGVFRLTGVPLGPRKLELRIIGYRTVTVELVVEPAAAAIIELVLEPAPVRVDSVAVTADRNPSMQGFDQRRERSAGHFFTGEEISASGARTLTDLLRRIPGARIESISGPFGGRQVVQMGRAIGISGPARCDATFYVNGQYFPISTATGIDGFVRPEEIEGLEVYSGASRVPPQFNSATDSRCGVVLIWTRNSSR
jgi:hypothetical protein